MFWFAAVLLCIRIWEFCFCWLIDHKHHKMTPKFIVYPEKFICAKIRPSAWKFYLRTDKFMSRLPKTLHPLALVYSCTPPQFYLLKGSDHVVSNYYSVNFLLTWPFFCRNTTPSEYCCSFANTRPLHFFTLS